METRTLKQYVAQLNSDAPTPGGGSAAAYVAALSVSLVNMALKISIKRKSFQLFSEQEKEMVQDQLTFFYQQSLYLPTYMQQDEVAFARFLKALQEKDKDIEIYQLECLRVPSELACLMMDLIKRYHQVSPYIVASIIGDLKMGLFFARAVLQGCLDNIEINLKGLSDLQKKADSLQLIQAIKTSIQSLD